MRILEVRDGFIKFETKGTITLASFLEAQENEKTYIAQIVKIKQTGEYTIGFAKILYLYDGLFNNLDGSSPSASATLKPFAYELISKSFDAVSTISIGNSLDENATIKLSKEIFNKNIIASINAPKTIKNLVKNLVANFTSQGKIVVIDTLGILDYEKAIAGVDFKLPLNTEALTFMYEDCLTDATSDSKNLTKDIFQELGEYSKTVPFLPFSALKTIVDEMVEKQHIFKLLVLKNKLAKFDKQGYFASNAEEAKNIETLLNSKNSILDLSKLDPVFLNRYLHVIYSTIKMLENKPQVIVLASNAVSKKALKPILTETDIPSFLITNSRFRYLNEIKTMVKNFIVEPNFANNENFKTYSMFLSAMPQDSCLVVGEGTNFIPIVTNIQELSDIDIDVKVDDTKIPEEAEKTENVIGEEPIEIILPETIKDEQTVAIEKKSEVLIDRLTEEVETTTPAEIGNLFNSEETELDSAELTEEVNESEEETTLEETTESSEELTLSSPENFSTEIHPVIIEDITENNEIEIPSEISELAIEPEDDEEDIIQEEDNREEGNVVNEIPLIEELVIEPQADDDTYSNNEEILEIDENVNEGLFEEELIEEPVKTIDVIPLDEDEFGEVVEINDEDFEGDEEILVELDIEDNVEHVDIETLSPQDLDGDDILEKVLDEEMQNEELDREIAEDVDKVFTTIKEQNDEDMVSDSDLDLIDELNSEKTEEVLLEEYNSNGSLEELSDEFSDELDEANEGFIEPLEEFNSSSEDEAEPEILETRNTSTPIVPVYDADIPKEDIVMSDPIEQGDSVVHAKYGNGIVEKMINYGTKTLYSINFENVGRRLLDPTLTEIKKS